VRYFAQKYARRMKKPINAIPTKSMTSLTEYHWPAMCANWKTSSSAPSFYRQVPIFTCHFRN
jgi:hypothetical protein